MSNIIIPKRSSVAGKVPTSGDLQIGEIAINLADGLLYSKDAGGVVVTIGGGGGLPSQTGNGGKYLTTDGSAASWESIGTFADDVFALTDNVDATKKAVFQLSGLTTATTHTYTVPNISATLAHLGNASQTFTGTVQFSNASGFFGMATSNSSSTLAGGATLNGLTKTVNIGTAGASGSTTNVIIGSSVSGATTNVTAYGAWTFSTAVPTLPNQTATYVFAGPTSGAAAIPSFRALAATDIPTLNQSTTGSAATLTTPRTITIGSTGKTFNGGADVSWTLAEIGAYAATNPSGYTSNTGTVTSVAALTLGTTGTDVSSTVATGTTTPVITLNIPTASATNRGALSAADWTTFNNKTSNTGTVTSVGGTGTVSGLTLTGTVTGSGNLTLGGTLTVGVANLNGGTGASSSTFWRGDGTWATVSASDPTKLPLAGGTMTGLITGRTSGLSMSQDGGATVGSFVCRASGTGDANLAGMTFWNDSYAVKMGVRADGYLGIGGWSAAAWRWYLNCADGTMTAAGNVNASSDETLKTNWRSIQDDFIEQLAQVKHGIYDRTDIELTQVGVSAQSLRPVLSHAVTVGSNGKLSVSYGNAALVAAIKLAERLVQLEKRLAELEN